MSERPLSKDGYRMRQALAEAGYEATPDELADALDEACERDYTGGAPTPEPSPPGGGAETGACGKPKDVWRAD